MSTDALYKTSLKDVMQQPLTTREDSSIEIAFAKLSSSPSEMVEIVDNDGKLKGTATKTSVMKALLEGSAQKSDAITKAMYSSPLSINENLTVQDAIKMLNDKKVDKLPVVDNEGKLVGTVSRKDLLRKAGSFLRIKL